MRQVQKWIRVTCTGASLLPFSLLKPFQGSLKILTAEKEQKLRASILRYGISFPFFVWQQNGDNYVIDGHQRDFVLRKLLQEGYKVPKIPVDFIQAKNKKEAREKILLISSQYGEMTEYSLDKFALDSEISLPDMHGVLSIPGIDFDLPSFLPASEDDQGKLDVLDPKMVTCPFCSKEFDLRGQD